MSGANEAEQFCDDANKGRGNSARVKDMAIGAIVAVFVAVLVVNHMNPHFGGSYHEDSAPQPTWNTDSNEPVHEKSNLRHDKTSNDYIHEEMMASKYKKFQPFGFEIYTGGASALIPTPETANDKHPLLMNNPECEGRLDSLGHFDEDTTNVTLPITFWACYLGLDDQVDDALRRLEIMTDAVERAYELSDKNSDTLKVFNAPEFFFRGRRGAYVYEYKGMAMDGEEECEALCQLLRGFEKLVAQEKYKDWLFLFGTIIVAEGPLPDSYESDYWQAGDYLVYNFAPVYKGYDPKVTDATGKRYIVPKRFMSQFDFLTSPAQYNGSIADELDQMNQYKYQKIVGERSYYDKDSTDLFIPVPPENPKYPPLRNPQSLLDYQLYYDQDMWKKYDEEIQSKGYKLLKHHWLIMDNVTLSIEICLDHLSPSAVAFRTAQVDDVMGSPARIPQTSEVWNPSLNKYEGRVDYVQIPRNKAQISLVSSMGMEADFAAFALADGGTLILQDGEKPGYGTMTQEPQCTGFLGPVFHGGSQVITRTADFGETSYDYYHHKMNKPFKSARVYDDEASFRKMADGVFTVETYKPTIHAYNSLPLAGVNA